MFGCRKTYRRGGGGRRFIVEGVSPARFIRANAGAVRRI